MNKTSSLTPIMPVVTIVALCIALSILMASHISISRATKPQQCRMVSITCDFAYSHTIGPLEATSTEKEHLGWSFFLPDRGIVTITKIEKDFYDRTTISVGGNRKAREAEILLLSPKAVKQIERKDNAG